MRVVTRLSQAARAVPDSAYEQNCQRRDTSLAKPLASSCWRIGGHGDWAGATESGFVTFWTCP